MTKIKFKLESEDILYHLIHSIYSNKDLFLRELISNSNDACEKMYLSNISNEVKDSRDNYKINISVNNSKRELTIKDNGIGMTYQDIEEYIGTIAKSGTKDFKQKFEQETEIIGQFGIGFYSAFLVSESIEVITKSPLESYGVRFFSDGLDGYILEKIFVDQIGTKVTCKITDIVENSKYLSFETIKSIVKKHSNYVKHSIFLNNGAKEEKINDQYPYWSNLQQSDEQDKLFVKSHFSDTKPIEIFKFNIEGKSQVKALLFIKEDKDSFSGIEIYSNNHFVTKSTDFLPKYLSFISGVIDIFGSGLNLSREQLSIESELNSLKSTFEKKILRELKLMLSSSRDIYINFWEKYREDLLQVMLNEYEVFFGKEIPELFIFKTSFNNQYTTLNEYIERNIISDSIYYVYSQSEAAVINIPQYLQALSNKQEVLILTNFYELFNVSKSTYSQRQFKSITDEHTSSKSETERSIEKESIEKYSRQLERIKLILTESIKDVSLVSLDSKSLGIIEDSSKVNSQLSQQFSKFDIDFKPIINFKLNVNADQFDSLMQYLERDPRKFDDMVSVVFNSSKILYGLNIDNPVDYVEKIQKLLLDDKSKNMN